jgi:hypothetical protein
LGRERLFPFQKGQMFSPRAEDSVVILV